MTDPEVPTAGPPAHASEAGTKSACVDAAAALSRPARLSRAKRLLFSAAVAGVSLLAALLLAEVVVRVAMPQPLAPPLYAETPYGFGVLPNLRGLTVESDARRAYHVTTDAHGFRGRRPIDDAPTSGTRRVLVLGDSFTFGVGVEDDETFVARAEALLNGGGGGKAASAERYELINASCPGWGTENELGFWRQEGRRLRPDLLVVVYFQNDLFDNLRNQVYRVSDGRVEPAPAPPSVSLARRLARAVPFYGFLCAHSHLANLVRRTIASRAATGRDASLSGPAAASGAPLVPKRQASAGAFAPATPPADAATTAVVPGAAVPSPAPLARELAVYRALMEALLDDTARNRVRVLLVILPWTADVEGQPTPHLTEVERLAAEWERSRPGFSVLDAFAPILAANRRGEDLFLPVDRHFTPAGHRLVGDLLAERIRAALEKEQP